MNIRTNLNRYFLIASILIGVLIAFTVFNLTVKFYQSGFFSTARVMLKDTAKALPPIDGNCLLIADIHACKSSEDLPLAFVKISGINQMKVGDFAKDAASHQRFATPDIFYFVYKTENQWGQELFIAKVFYREATEVGFLGLQIEMYWWGLFVGLLVALLITIILMIVLNQMVLPIERLRQWALDLANNRTNIQSPDYKFSELNEVSTLLSESIAKQREVVEQEREFLQHTSHELRTPIAACQSNLELLSKLVGASATKPVAVIKRIDQAVKTMTDLTNTFLWLSQSEVKRIKSKPESLGEMVRESVEALQYLIDQKEIELKLELDQQLVNLPKAPCKIVILNMVRNAFQHTLNGQVHIYQCGEVVKVINTDESGFEADDLGFGLGLRLIRKIAYLYQWRLDVNKSDNTYSIEVTFNTD